jgi:hypothetical protein
MNVKIDNISGLQWDEYGNPSPIIDGEQYIIDYNRMEEEWEMDNYNEMKDEELYRPKSSKESN